MLGRAPLAAPHGDVSTEDAERIGPDMGESGFDKQIREDQGAIQIHDEGRDVDLSGDLIAARCQNTPPETEMYKIKALQMLTYCRTRDTTSTLRGIPRTFAIECVNPATNIPYRPR